MKGVIIIAILVSVCGFSASTNFPCPESYDGSYHFPADPRPKYCNSFYMCDNGVAKLFHCGAGLHFNADTQVCDWPHNAGCENIITEREELVESVDIV